jgi:hypothetical protein
MLTAVCRLLNLSFSLLAAGSMTNPDDESKLFVASWVTISNLVAVGYTGSIEPNSFGGFTLGIVQQLQGILLQAFLFSVAVTRFQMPQADLILSDNLLFTNRFHTPHLIFRIGNLRCNMIFNRTRAQSSHRDTVLAALCASCCSIGSLWFSWLLAWGDQLPCH